MAAPIPTSQTLRPGYIPNTGDFDTGQYNHSDWLSAFVKYYAAKWAHGDHTVPEGWVSAEFGEPDPADTEGNASPRTLLAFARYAAAYKPGMSAQVDQTFPYIAPGANDYVEDPAVTATKIAQDQWDKTFAQTQSNQDRQAWQQAWTNDLSKWATETEQWNTQNAFAKGVFDTQAGMRNSDNSFNSSVYSTLGSIYNTGETNAGQRLQSAGTLAQGLQGLYDARTNKAIELKAHPGDFVQSEYATRALTAPNSTQVPGYQNVDALGEVINKLINYVPGQAPTAPTVQAQPTAPTITKAPSSPTQQTLAQWIGKNTAGGLPPAQTQTTTTVTPAASNPFPNGLKPGETAQVGGVTQVGQQGPGGNTLPGTRPQHYAEGSRGFVDVAQAIVGDPQADGQPNPELLETRDDGKVRITPLRAFAYGSQPGGNSGAMTSYTPPAGGSYWDKGQVQAGGSDGSLVGNRSNLTPTEWDGMRSYADQAAAAAQPKPESASAKPVYAGSAPSATPAASASAYAPQVTLPQYDDSAYQNLPLLRYMQGLLGRTGFGTLATGTTPGAFGTAIPEAGAVNYNSLLRVMSDPVAAAMLSSLYSSGNRDLSQTMAQAKARAPLGQALNTSLVRT